MGLWRDSSGRLTFDLATVEAKDYAAVCRGIADAFDLTPATDIVAGAEQMFWDFRRDDLLIGLDWDIWMGLMAVAKSEASEPLLRDIAAWLTSTPQPEP